MSHTRVMYQDRLGLICLMSNVQVWLPAMKAKGLEISGTFARRAGVIQMEMTLTNKAMSPMGDFAIQFNRNR